MKRQISGFGIATLLAVASFTAACQKNQTTTQTSTEQTSTQQQASTDTSTEGTAGNPDNGNLAAPVASTSSSAQPASYNEPSNDTAANSYPDYDYNADVDTDEQPVYAQQPPPPLPDYQQPECPQEGDVWTPGYWNYTSTGYYWVPGAWVLAPYVGALWTPPYWGYTGGRYVLHHGYWARNIGFYGGVNYGYGYTGRGYYGGYWQNNQFFYNRAVNRVNQTAIRNVYDHNVPSVNNARVSYNGGRGGIQMRPTPAELAVLRQPRVPPVDAQVRLREQSASNHALFYQTNHGRPPQPVLAHPLATSYHAPAAKMPEAHVIPARNTPAAQPRPETRTAAENRPAATPNRPEARTNERAAQPNNRPGANARPEPNNRPAANARPEARPATRPEAQPSRPAEPNARPATNNAPANRPAAHPAANQPHPAANQPHPAATQPRPAATQPRPAATQPRPESRPAPASHAQPQPKTESRPAPAAQQQHPAARPQQQHQPAKEPNKDTSHQH